MGSTRSSRLIATSLMLVAFAASWRLVGPAQLGGTASYVITHGISMEPEYHEGDLVLLRPADGYAKGDVIGYHSGSLNRTVLHRIHHLEDGAFVTKGDNNSWLDTDRPKDADVLGRTWLHIPGAGKALAMTRSPVIAATLLGLVALTFLMGKESRKRRGRKGQRPQLTRISFGNFSDQQKTWMAIPTGFLVAFLLLGVVAFRSPLVSAVSADAAFEHVGAFTYGASVPKSAVYPTGQVDPGRPVFRRVIDRLSIGFTYRLRSEVSHSISGEALMFARVSGSAGWKKAIPLSKAERFEGDSVSLKGTLDLDAIQRLSAEVQDLTGIPESAQTVEIVPRIAIEGSVGGTTIGESFSPTLRFNMDAAQLRLMTASGAAVTPGQPPAELHPTQPGQVRVSDTEANRLGVLGMSIDTRAARTTSLLGIVLALMALAYAWFKFSNPSHADEASLIQAQYGEWLIPVEAMDRSGSKVVRIKSIESLVRLAELYERMILHDEGASGHSYFVEEDGVVYCYSTKESAGAPPKQPSRSPKFSGRQSREERRKAQVERLREELAEIEQEVLKAGPADD